ncbi:MAG: DUF4097 family beta strand repeat protein [Clostridia bacterium]|nr:DUF4097 family beta strand repeat protein [Clostridia bacterium]
MRGRKRGLIVAAVLLAAGALVCGAALASAGFDFSRLGMVEYKTNTYAVSGDFQHILLRGDREKIVFAPSEDGACRVVCREDEKEPHAVRVENDTLTVESTARRAWFFVDFSFLTSGPSVTVYLPRDAYGALSVEGQTGDVAIPADFSFDSIQVTLSTGSVDCRAASADAVRVKTSTGGVRIADVACRGDVEVRVSTGGAVLENVTCQNLLSDGSTGGLTLKNVIASGKFDLRRSTGGIRFESCDAETILVKTSTGSVTGTLRSGKVFSAHSDTGRVEVPGGGSGGRCEITTSTGGIRIGIENQ